MRRASLLVACFATLCSPALSQTGPEQDQPPVSRAEAVEADGRGERDPVVSRVVIVSEPVLVPKTRSLAASSPTRGRIDFSDFWQTGIYQ